MSDYFDLPRITLKTEPISIPDDVFAIQVERELRSAAEAFRVADWKKLVELNTTCGNHIIEAHKRGLLILPGLAELIKWHTTGSTNDPVLGREGAMAVLVRCPSNLFCDVVGGNHVQVHVGARIEETGAPEIADIGSRVGGLLPRMHPVLLTMEVVDRSAHACELLADLVRATALQRSRNTPSLPITAPPRYEFRRSGKVWILTYEGFTSQIPERSAKGLSYIQQTIRSPHHRIHVTELESSNSGQQGRVPKGTSDPIVDDPAQRALRNRCDSLQDELEEARRNSDEGRIEALMDELSRIAAQLKSSMGLGGHSRNFSDAGERRRKSVSTAIARAIDLVSEENPRLAYHLRAFITTGYEVSYAPDCDLPWRT